MQFLPITFENNWFIGCYLLFYIIHPAMNCIIVKLNQKNLLSVNLIGIFLYSFCYMVLGNRYYYTHLVGFIMIYFLVAYVKLYLTKVSASKRINIIIVITSTILLVVSLVLLNYLGLQIDALSYQMLRWRGFNNPIILALALGLFNFFRMKPIQSEKINIVSRLTIYVYMIHDNYLLYTYIKPKLWEQIYQTYAYTYVVIYVIIFAIVSFVGSVIVALIYCKLFDGVIDQISEFVVIKSKNMMNKITEKLMSIQ